MLQDKKYGPDWELIRARKRRADLRNIQELSGHCRSTTTEIYTHLSFNKIGKIRSPLAYLQEKKRQGME